MSITLNRYKNSFAKKKRHDKISKTTNLKLVWKSKSIHQLLKRPPTCRFKSYYAIMSQTINTHNTRSTIITVYPIGVVATINFNILYIIKIDKRYFYLFLKNKCLTHYDVLRHIIITIGCGNAKMCEKSKNK